jgi:hypothetical protein
VQRRKCFKLPACTKRKAVPRLLFVAVFTAFLTQQMLLKTATAWAKPYAGCGTVLNYLTYTKRKAVPTLLFVAVFTAFLTQQMLLKTATA